MDNFKLLVRKDRMRADGTYTVYVRYTHGKHVTYLPTTMVAQMKKDLTASFKIKNQQILDRGDDLIREYRRKLNTLMLELNDIPFARIVERLKMKDESTGIYFTDYCSKWLSENESKKGIRNYHTAIRSFIHFHGDRKILMSEVTVARMNDYVRYLSGKKRAISLYTNAIVKIFSDARDYYNDYDNNVIRIRESLSGFKTPKQNIAEKRAVEVDVIRKIMNLPRHGDKGLFDQARDCFLISFCLMGINAIDLYNLTDYDGKTITYHRTKTRDRRSDGARMVVHVPAIIKPILDEYLSHSERENVLNFADRYSNCTIFNCNLSIGLKRVREALGLDRLQFYSARHSMATIAVNDVRIPIYIVNDMLCHIDESMRVTNLYVKKDYSAINEANKTLIEYVFGEGSY